MPNFDPKSTFIQCGRCQSKPEVLIYIQSTRRHVCLPCFKEAYMSYWQQLASYINHYQHAGKFENYILPDVIYEGRP